MGVSVKPGLLSCIYRHRYLRSSPFPFPYLCPTLYCAWYGTLPTSKILAQARAKPEAAYPWSMPHFCCTRNSDMFISMPICM
eukprot:10233043-Karenia_brevis.AAC.1